MSEYQNVKKSKLSFKGGAKKTFRKRDESRTLQPSGGLPHEESNLKAQSSIHDEIKILNGSGE